MKRLTITITKDQLLPYRVGLWNGFINGFLVGMGICLTIALIILL